MKSSACLGAVKLLLAGLACAGAVGHAEIGASGGGVEAVLPTQNVELDRRVAAWSRQAVSSPELLARQLTDGLSSDVDKLYVLYHWVVRHVDYDVDAYFSGNLRAAAGAQQAFRSGKAVCDGYAELLLLLGRAAGLEIEKVSGYGKGFSFDPAKAALGQPLPENHAWNAVKLNGRWQLLDATWDAGHVDALTRQFVRRPYPGRYWLSDPALFVSDHFPAEARWQLLERPISRDEFLSLAEIPPDLRAWGLDVSRHASYRVTVPSSPYVFDFGPAARGFSARLSMAGKPLEGPWTLVTRNDQDVPQLLVSVPAPGHYDLALFLSDPTGRPDRRVLQYHLVFQAAGALTRGFPVANADPRVERLALRSPLDGQLPAEREIDFELGVPDAESVAVAQVTASGESVYHELTRNGGRFQARLTLTPGPAFLVARYRGSETYSALLQYQVRSGP